MNAKNNNSAILLVVGLVLLLCALPAEWMTFGATIQIGDGLKLNFSEMLGVKAAATGLNGHITALGIQFPIWLVLVLGILSLALLFLKIVQGIAFSKAAALIPWGLSLALVLFALATGASSDEAHLGLGGFLALGGLLLGGLPLLLARGN
jgi:hypothetical protein